MRFVFAMALALLLAGCADGPPPPHADQGAASSGDPATDNYARLAGEQFDYRYAFRIPGNRVKAVLDSHSQGCVRLGPARCRILDQRYALIDGKASAYLTYRIDPAIARQFGDNAAAVVNSANGTLLESSIAGFDNTTAARENALVARLRQQLANAQAQRAAAPADSPQRQFLQDRVARLQLTLSTIAEVEAGEGGTLATTPVLISYSASGTGTAIGNGATFEDAWTTFSASIAGMAQALAGPLPFILLLVLGALLLRWIVQRGFLGSPEEQSRDRGSQMAVPVPHPDDERPNVIRRWFQRDDADAEHQ